MICFCFFLNALFGRYVVWYKHPEIFRKFRVWNWSIPSRKMIQLLTRYSKDSIWWETCFFKLDGSTTNYIACLTHPVSLPKSQLFLLLAFHPRRTRWRRVPATTMHSELPCKRKSKTGDLWMPRCGHVVHGHVDASVKGLSPRKKAWN